MKNIQHNGRTYEEADLLPAGDRVSPWAIKEGLMKEIPVTINGQQRHLPLFTNAGMAKLQAEFREGLQP